MSSTVASGFTHDDQNPQSRLETRVSSEPPPSSRDRLSHPSNIQAWANLDSGSKLNFASRDHARQLGLDHGTDISGASVASRKPARSVDLVQLEDRGKGRSAVTRSSGQSTDEHRMQDRLACPYFKRTRQFTRASCAGPGWQTVHRLRQHLDRAHRVHQCDRCGEIFQSPDALIEHRRAVDPCSIKDFDPNAIDPTIGMTDATFDEVKRRRPPRGISESEKWTQLYKILFGETEKVPSPYYEYDRGSNIHGDDGFPGMSAGLYRERLEAIVRQLVNEEVELNMPSMESKLLESIENIVTRAIYTLLRDNQSDCRSLTGSLEASLPSKPSLDGTSPVQMECLQSTDRMASSTLASSTAVSIPTSAKPMSSHESVTTPDAISSMKNEGGFSVASWARASSVRSESPDSTHKYYCPYCLEAGRSKGMKTKHDWKRHIMNFHETPEEWACVCGSKFHSHLDLKDHHKERHHGQRPSYRVYEVQKKRVYACGYTNCIKAYSSFKEWCDHVASEMTESRQRNWDYSWRIHNILRSLNLKQAWHTMAEPILQGAGMSLNDLTWEPKKTHDLLRRLETYCSDENPYTLVHDLFSQSKSFSANRSTSHSVLSGQDLMHVSTETPPEILEAPILQEISTPLESPFSEQHFDWMDGLEAYYIDSYDSIVDKRPTLKDTPAGTVGQAITK